MRRADDIYQAYVKILEEELVPAKASCAAKIASSVDTGIMGYYMYENGQQFHGGDGIVTKGVEATIRNIGRLGKEGMKETNEEIIKIMVDE